MWINRNFDITKYIPKDDNYHNVQILNRDIYVDGELADMRGVDYSSKKHNRECCDVGTYKCQVPMPINGRIQGIDFCIADIVAALNAANIITVASCCGHNKQDGVISLEDGRELIVKFKNKNHSSSGYGIVTESDICL